MSSISDRRNAAVHTYWFNVYALDDGRRWGRVVGDRSDAVRVSAHVGATFGIRTLYRLKVRMRDMPPVFEGTEPEAVAAMTA
ncbi:hypothetical protein ACFQ12_07880 [Methylobacterium trifolii]